MSQHHLGRSILGIGSSVQGAVVGGVSTNHLTTTDLINLAKTIPHDAHKRSCTKTIVLNQ
eukprot:6391752-Amphidinium_carterae.1